MDYQQYDFSDYPDTHPCFNKCPIPTKYIQSLNKKVVGKFKDEEEGVPITEFVGIRAKCYSYKRIDGITRKKNKGIKKSVVKQTIQHEHYKQCLFDDLQLYASMNTITKSKLSDRQNRRSLTLTINVIY